jgi:opacity protein-like surface antigen
MKSLVLFSTFFILAVSAVGQERITGDRVYTEGLYGNIGVVNGPAFADFFDFINDTYSGPFNNSVDKIDKFGSAAVMSAGYLYRFYPNFALDVGFSIYRLKSSGKIINNNYPVEGPPHLQHELEYQVGIFSATIPVFLDFSIRQPVVPYVGIGISVFAMRLDDFVDDGFILDAYRDTGTSIGGHFEAGTLVRVTPKIWINIKGRWYKGSGHLRAFEPPRFLSKFTIEHDISQLSAGVVYYFR